MIYPGYLLNPGDMFQVDPERVMFATGATKAPPQIAEGNDAEDAGAAPEEPQAAAETPEIDVEREPREVLKDLLSQAKTILASPREKLGAKKKQDLRAFSQSVKRMLSKSKSSTILTDSFEAQFLELQNQLNFQREKKLKGEQSLPSEQAEKVASSTAKPGSAAGVTVEPSVEDSADSARECNIVSDREYNELFAALTEMQENPVDDSKPYATPWMPRDYMSAFAFIPRYLEVNPNICAAVYIRHPVARPGLAEVPTPFSEGISGNAFAWYLRRR